MPELPDLQAFSANLTRLIGGKTVREVEVLNSKKLNVSTQQLTSSLCGKKVQKVFREGKELYIQFDQQTILALHFMLHGQLHLFEGKPDKKFQILAIYFTDNTGVVMTDFQGQAKPTLNPERPEGEDALSDVIDFKFLKEKFSKSKAAVKNVLTDQRFIRGIGNAYADEIFWESRISPFSVANKIPDDKIRLLAKAIKKVLKEGEENILRKNPEIISGEVRDFLKIHNSRKKESPGGAPIKTSATGGRKTYHTDEQELFE